MEKLTQFATAVGGDVKQLKATDVQLKERLDELSLALENITQNGVGVSSEEVDLKLHALKAELFGGDVDAALDTFKELGEKLMELGNDETIKGAVLAKFSEIGEELTSIKEAMNVNLLDVYEKAKQA